MRVGARFWAIASLGAMTLSVYAQWKPADGPLMTRWAKDVSPDKVLPEYPRPQMARSEWQNLNGLWDYAIRPKTEARPARFDGQILVPFPVEAALSGVMKRVGDDERLWYRRTFELPETRIGRRILLHFGAVDWEATVFVNGQELGQHRGGYDPFEFDITNALQKSGPQEIVVAVWDPTDAGTQPRGKQVRKPESIWYTSTTGIWQTVWLEPVPQWRIEGLVLTPDVDHSRLVVDFDDRKFSSSNGAYVVVLDGGREVARASGLGHIEVSIPDPQLWSPENPFLYDVRVVLHRFLEPNAIDDEVRSYFAMRKISTGPDAQGVTRLLLNNKPLFMLGTLDQGFWPDGLYTAPTDEALRSDIEVLRKLGFNMTRKHVKVEADRWYYWCDKLGLLVWQDMPSGDADPAQGQKEIQRSKESAEQYELELRRLIETHRNHPCIVMWVPFNEGWGQFDTRRIAEWVKKLDPTRLVDSASGWSDLGVGDVVDVHDYPGPSAPRPEPHRAAVLGEFGGLGLSLAGHTWQQEKSWGYRSFKTQEELTTAYVDLLAALRPLVTKPGLSAAVYTQTTDVEIEVNGLMTYDRALLKLDETRATTAARELRRPTANPEATGAQ
jgi:beta-galactosidase/beta-glucuronidase